MSSLNTLVRSLHDLGAAAWFGGSFVADSRAGRDGDDHAFVGRAGPDVAQDVEQSGAEARSELKRLTPQPSTHSLQPGQRDTTLSRKARATRRG